jgi:hypothetical protein
LIRSSTRVVPSSFSSWLDTAVTGLTLVRFGCGMREPVTTNSWTVEADVAGTATGAPVVFWAAWAKAPPADAARATVVIMDEASRRARAVLWIKRISP